MSAPIEINAPDAAWAQAFDQAAQQLRPLVGPEPRIEHIGSTAVPGLSSKPVIDILIGVAESRDPSDLAEVFEIHGFERGVPAGAPAANVFLSRGAVAGGAAINLHLTVMGGREWRDLIRFRDKLRSDPAVARRYEKLKRRLAATSADLDSYTAGKGAFVAQVLEGGP
jgi:GrpB-like predicted nucleotidyltransferase (UPF0157 family)